MKIAYFSPVLCTVFLKPAAQQSGFPWGDTNTLTGSRQCQLLLQLQGLPSLNSSTGEPILLSPPPCSCIFTFCEHHSCFPLVNYQDKQYLKDTYGEQTQQQQGKSARQREKRKGKRFCLLGHKDKNPHILKVRTSHYLCSLSLSISILASSSQPVFCPSSNCFVLSPSYLLAFPVPKPPGFCKVYWTLDGMLPTGLIMGKKNYLSITNKHQQIS